MSMNASIIANGEVKNGAWLRKNISGIVIAADGGAHICRKFGITPKYIIGDFDSIQKSTLTFFEKKSIILHVPDQHTTDLQKALVLAKKLKAKRIFVFGALGKNIDHTMANILSLYENCIIRDETHEVWVVTKKASITGKPGDCVSIIALTNVTGLSYTGLKWKLSNASVPPGWIGVRNQLLGKRGGVRLKTGKLALITIAT